MANCVFVRPRRDTDDARRLRASCRQHALAAGYRVKTFHTRNVKVLGGSGRPLSVLGGEDASLLYKMLHRGPTLVVALTSAWISTDPSRDPPNRRAGRSLEDFVAYKALYGLVRADADVPSLFERFRLWQGEVNCDGPTDPRALPLHVFDAGPGPHELDSEAGAARFRRAFGGSAERKDHSDRTWASGASHGTDTLQVAGCALPSGTHWDVSGERNGCRVMNASEIWRLKRGGYVNVYPNEYIRPPRRNRRSQARRVWP